jgi:hypothetical protein
MTPDRVPAELARAARDPDPTLAGLARAARAYYYRAICCPADLWKQVAGHLAGRDVPATLAALPAVVQGVLRGCYDERTLSLRYLADGDEVFREIERWCLEGD